MTPESRMGLKCHPQNNWDKQESSYIPPYFWGSQKQNPRGMYNRYPIRVYILCDLLNQARFS